MADRLNASEWLLDRRVEAGDGDRVAVESGGERITYADLAGRTARAAAGLAALGVRPEERVPLVLPDGPEFVAVFLGAMRLGAPGWRSSRPGSRPSPARWPLAPRS